MTWITAWLTISFAGIPAGACTWQRVVEQGAVVTVMNSSVGRVKMPEGEWLAVRRLGDYWVAAIFQQVNEQCLKGGVKW